MVDSRIMRGLISDLLERHRRTRSVLSRMREHASYAKFLFWRLKVKARNFPEELSTPKICMVNPETVRYCLSGKLPRHQYQIGHVSVMSGNWDLLTRKIEDSDGYKTTNRGDFPNANGKRDQISVAIGRHGDFLLVDGLNKLLTAKNLQVQQIPAMILARHSRWQELRKEIHALALDGHLYQPATHPDIDATAEHFCEDRFNMMRDSLATQKGKLLDIGANFGYFCHRFEELGFECYAVENNIISLHYLKRFRRAENRKFGIIPKGIFEWQSLKELRFDVVLALNIFHHFLKRKRTYFELIDLLKRLQMKEMFFEPHLSGEYQMKSAYKKYNEKEFAEFILQNSNLKRADRIGTAKDGRTLYRLH